jgi:hypothetical protein
LGQLDALHTQNLEICHPKGTSHTKFDKTIDAQFGSLAVRRNKNKYEKNQLVSNDLQYVESSHAPYFFLTLNQYLPHIPYMASKK